MVILITLVLQGLTLPWIIRKVNLEDRHSTMSERDQEVTIQKKIAKVSVAHLQDKYAEGRSTDKHFNNLLERLKLDADHLQQDFDKLTNSGEEGLISYQHIYLDLLEQQRKLLNDMNRKAEFDEEIIRKYLGLVDIEEYKVREKFKL
jgi:CPA1 family monovalent cation:H+ antiporter